MLDRNQITQLPEGAGPQYSRIEIMTIGAVVSLPMRVLCRDFGEFNGSAINTRFCLNKLFIPELVGAASGCPK